MATPLRITHLITGLGPGGAEMMLLRLLAATDRERFAPRVISLSGVWEAESVLASLQIPVRCLGLGRGWPSPLALPRLARWIRQDRPDVLATWMYHGNFAGVLAAPLAGGVPVVWAIHHRKPDPETDRWRTIVLSSLCARISRTRLVAAIICCAESTLHEHAKLGYAAGKLTVVRNGFDMEVFRPRPEVRGAVRRELGVPLDAPVIFLAARFHPAKDLPAFFRVAGMMRAARPDCHFVLCGDGIDEGNAELAALAGTAGIGGRCRLLGVRQDVPRLLAAADVACLTSVTEAFPLAVGEAMACEVPCVVTDVGDAAAMVGDAGIVVPPRDAPRFAAACLGLVNLPPRERAALGRRARQRIAEHFGITRAVERYHAVYSAAARSSPVRRSELAETTRAQTGVGS